jgi:PilZ domain
MKFNQRSVDDGRRRFRSVPLESRVQIDSETDQLEAEAIDVSLNGILVRTSRILPLGSPVEVRLYLPPEAKAVVALGSVVRVSGNHQMAIRIDRMHDEESRRLEEHLLSLITTEP